MTQDDPAASAGSLESPPESGMIDDNLKTSTGTRRPRKRFWRFVLGGIGAALLGVALWFHFYPITFRLPDRIKSPVPGDFLLAVESVEVENAQIHFKPGHFRVAVSGHTIDVRPESTLTVHVDRLDLRVLPPDAKGGAAGTSAIELRTAQIRTEGKLSVAVDGLISVPLEKIQITAAPGDSAQVSAELLFAELIASVLTDVIHTGLAKAQLAQGDVELRTGSARVTSAVVSLRPGSWFRLPEGNTVTVAAPSQVRLHDLEYQAENGESWKAKADLDLSCAPPTQFSAGQVICQPGTSRLKLALDLALTRDRLTARLLNTIEDPTRLLLKDGSIKSTSPAWQADLKTAAVFLERLTFSGSRRGGRSAIDVSASVSSSLRIRWETDGWQASADLGSDQLKLSLLTDPSGTENEPEQLSVAAGRPVTFNDLTLSRDVGSGTLRIVLGSLSASGALAKALSVATSVDRFKAAGGKLDYQGRDGTHVSAEFAAGGSLDWKPPPSDPSAGPAPSQFAIQGTANSVEVASPKNEKLQLSHVQLDFASSTGNPPGIAVSCRGNISVLSDRLSIQGAEARVSSLELRPGAGNSVQGSVSVALSVPKAELCNAIRAELAKPITVKGGGIGRILDFDSSISDLSVNASGLIVSFAGPRLHVEGPISVSGNLTTSRRIVIPPLVDRKIVNHNDFTLEARISANAAATFPPVDEFAKQTVQIQFEYERAELQLGGFLGGLPFASDVFRAALHAFGIEDKLKAALPSKVSIDVFQKNTSDDRSSVLSKIRKHRIQLSDVPDRLELNGTANVEF
jgi:hypothetical protein